MLLRICARPPLKLAMPPPERAKLFVTVLRATLIGPEPALQMPPPVLVTPSMPLGGPGAKLPLTVLLVTLTVPVLLFRMPPPLRLEFASRVLSVTLTVPVVPLKTPPPETAAKLLLRVQPAMLTVPEALLLTPPPALDGKPPCERPLLIVNPEIVTLPKPSCALVWMLKMRKEAVFGSVERRTVNTFAPGPVIVRSLSMVSWPLVRVIGLTTWFMSKVMVLPGQAS